MPTDGYAQVLSAARMLGIEASSIVSGVVNEDGDLILTTHGGEEINAGHIVGEPGPPGAPGDSADLTTLNPVVIGEGSSATGDWQVSIGSYASTSDDDTVAIGDGATAVGYNATAIGSYMADGNSALALGGYAMAAFSIGVGGNVIDAAHIQSIMIGHGAQSTAPNQTMVKNDELILERRTAGQASKLIFCSPNGTHFPIYIDNNGNLVGVNQIQTTVLTAINGNGVVVLGKSARIEQVAFAGAGRFRLYRTSDGRTTDASRPFNVIYPKNAGLLYDYNAAAAAQDLESPLPIAWAIGETTYYYIASGPVTVTITWVKTGD